MEDRLVIANCSGFFGDRFAAAREMVEGGPIHVLTGDYLAELTMAILFQKKLKDPEAGYVTTFLKQMEEVLVRCLESGIKVVANAGGLNPRALAQELRQLADRLGLQPKIATVSGDDLLPRLQELQAAGEAFTHLDTGLSLAQSGASPISANVYLGGWGIARALEQGADIVVTGRVADAALVSGPAAWYFGWDPEDCDQLAGAWVAGHVIECGAQATGGNYSFFQEVPSFEKVGFPLAEVFANGSSCITKHPGTGGLVTVGTVTAQLLYEIQGPDYLSPDVTVRFDTIQLEQEGPDRVRIHSVRGQPPTDTAKVCCNTFGGYRNTMTVILTGLDIEAKARVVEQTLFQSLGGRDRFEQAQVQLIPAGQAEDPDSNETAFAYLRISVRDPDRSKAGREFSAKVVELALANIPGFTLTSPPTDATPAVVHWPALVSKDCYQEEVEVDGQTFLVAPLRPGTETVQVEPLLPELPRLQRPRDTVHLPLGRLFATRSGDKGGNANLGVWATTPAAYAYLARFLTLDRLAELLPEVRDCEVERYELPNLLALNFYIRGFLGEGVAASFKLDPQAKTLGEYLRAKVIEVPQELVPQAAQDL